MRERFTDPYGRLKSITMKSVLFRILLFACSLTVQAQQSPVANQTPEATVAGATAARGVGPAVVAPSEKTRPVSVPRFEAPPVIDGELDERAGALLCARAPITTRYLRTCAGSSCSAGRPTPALRSTLATTTISPTTASTGSPDSERRAFAAMVRRSSSRCLTCSGVVSDSPRGPLPARLRRKWDAARGGV
jgi:hypothetical protein